MMQYRYFINSLLPKETYDDSTQGLVALKSPYTKNAPLTQLVYNERE